MTRAEFLDNITDWSELKEFCSEWDCDCCDDEDDDIEYYEIQCPHCNEIVVLDDSIDPSSIKCPACGKEFNAGE